MDKLIELLQQIQDLSNVAIDALKGASGGDKGGPPAHDGGEGKPGGPPHEPGPGDGGEGKPGGPPHEGGGGFHGGPPHEGGKPPMEDKKY